MIVPSFIRFYHYTLTQAMSEYAVSFFSMVNSMYRIQSEEMLQGISVASYPHLEKNAARDLLDELRKAARGLHGIVQEVRSIKK